MGEARSKPVKIKPGTRLEVVGKPITAHSRRWDSFTFEGNINDVHVPGELQIHKMQRLATACYPACKFIRTVPFA